MPERDLGGCIEALVANVEAIDVDTISAGELPDVMLRIEQLSNAVHALSAVVMDRFEREGDWSMDGALSGVAWTAQRTGSSRAAFAGVAAKAQR